MFQGLGLGSMRMKKQCDVVLEDGEVCTFTGTPAQVGKHRYDCHGQCNPIKAVTVTNQCPGCLEKFKTLRSAKEHAARAMKLGRCPLSTRASRP